MDLGKKLHIKEPDDWYTVTQKDVLSHGGKGLLNVFSGLCDDKIKDTGSPSLAIMNAFKEYNLKPWKFSSTHRGFWDSIDNQIIFLQDLAK